MSDKRQKNTAIPNFHDWLFLLFANPTLPSDHKIVLAIMRKSMSNPRDKTPLDIPLLAKASGLSEEVVTEVIDDLIQNKFIEAFEK